MKMADLITFLFLLLVTHDLPTCLTSAGCSISNSKCAGSGIPDVRFPFKFKDSNQPTRCGHPGFDLWCDLYSKRALIDLPNSGNFTIKTIDYIAQEIWVNDPNNCLPQKLLSFDLSGSPFSAIYHQDFTFFNCSAELNTTTHNNTTTSLENRVKGGPIKCLSNSTNYFVYATPSNGSNTLLSYPPTCSLMATNVKVPVQWPPSLQNATSFSPSSELNDDLRLTWFMPECRTCELNGQMCGLEINSNGSDQVIVCSNIPNSKGTNKVGKLPLTTFIAVILIICSPSIICLVGSLWIWIRACYTERSTRLQQTRSPVSQRPGHLVELGLEEANVEFAREMVLLGLTIDVDPGFEPTIDVSDIEEMGLSPTGEGDQSVCAICMGEYRPKGRIGKLPTCGHFFHADCIDKWLRSRRVIERTCPICRAQVG